MATERLKLLKTPFKERTKKTDVFNVFHYTDLMRKKHTREGDPYEYQHGWGNHHMGEVIPGTLPVAQNNPQAPRFGLYVEGLTGSSFGAPRAHNYSTYIYRVRPAAAHSGFQPMETKANIQNCFLSINPKVKSLPEQAEWAPFPLPKEGEKIDFIDGLHTLGGSGDPNLREGIALYIYTINADMGNRAIVNSDGEFLITAQLGDLDIQTEMGMIYLAPGEICVIPRGIRFKVKLGKNTTEARGYITEVWGSVWELPDLGPIGGHGLANPRDFLFPVAHIDENLKGDWIVVLKTGGEYHALAQDHSPFDLVAWHGNIVPYKYDLTKFVSQNATSVDHTDPSINTVLTAKSRDPNTALADFLWFGPRWDVATNSFRPPYFHRNAASEFLTTLFGNGLGRSDDFQPGGGSYEQGHTPHGGFEEVYVTEMRNMENEPRKILEGGLTIMIESSRTFLWTEYARIGCGTLHTQGTNPRVWDVLPDNFSNNPEAQALLKRVKEDKAHRAERDRVFYEDEALDQLLAGKMNGVHVDGNGVNGVNGH